MQSLDCEDAATPTPARSRGGPRRLAAVASVAAALGLAAGVALYAALEPSGAPGGVAATFAFVPGVVPRAAGLRGPEAAERRRPRVAPRMGYLDELVKPDDKVAVDSKGTQIMPNRDYEGFIDSDGFDGGDGQVGVVGDGSNAMETFDNREIIKSSSTPAGAIGGRDAGTAGKFGASSGLRVDKRWNAWGTDSGDETYKEQLKKDGVVDVDMYGNDWAQVKRQQMENWANQQAQWKQERDLRDQMASVGAEKRQKNTDDYKDFLATGKSNDEMTAKDMENVIFATGAKGIDNTAQLKKTDWRPCKAGFRIDGEFEIVGSGFVTIPVAPNSMVSEQYIARFTDDSPAEFVVAKRGGDVGDRQVDGSLPRRGDGVVVDFTVRFNPSGPIGAPLTATLVIDQEDGWKWTYKITGRT